MATNAETVVDDDKQVTEEDLRDLKYGSEEVETDKTEDESTDPGEHEEDSEEAGDEDGKADESQDEDSEEDDKTDSDDDSSEYVKEFPNIKGDSLEDYARNLEEAYKNSTAEALRLKGLADAKPDDEPEDKSEPTISDPLSLYMKQKMDEEINSAFTDFSKEYPQVSDQSEYDKFTREVAVLSQAILTSQKRLAPPKELYSKAAVILGWESNGKPSGKEKVGIAVKGNASVTKTSSGTGKTKSKSKVTDQMIAASKLMYPGKSDQEIREELEPHVQ